MHKMRHWGQWLFPVPSTQIHPIPPIRQALIFAGLFAVFYSLAHFLPTDSILAFDWVSFFGVGNIPIFYPPWTRAIVSVLNYPALVGLTLAAVGLASLRRVHHPLSLTAAFFSLPVLWTVFLGQIDGLVLLGLIGLPWLAPLALLKPQVAFGAFFARPGSLLVALISLLVSFTVWGFWPAAMFSVWQVHAEGTYVNDIALGLYGLPLALILGWFSRGDEDMLILAGAFTSPYLLPYSLIVACPAIARLHPIAALVAGLLSWLPFSANWLGPHGWWLGWVFIAFLWVALAWQRYRHRLSRKTSQPDPSWD